MGGSEFYNLFNELGAHLPIVRKEGARRIYEKMMAANKDNLIVSAHDISDGGLAVALAESAFGGNLGADIELPLDGLSVNAALFAESHSRFIVSVDPQNQTAFESIFKSDSQFLGIVVSEKQLRIQNSNNEVINLSSEKMLAAWQNGLDF